MKISILHRTAIINPPFNKIVRDHIIVNKNWSKIIGTVPPQQRTSIIDLHLRARQPEQTSSFILSKANGTFCSKVKYMS